MIKIAYIMGTFPSWSETFIAQELELLLSSSDVAILPVALRPGEGDTLAKTHYLYDRQKGASQVEPPPNSSRPFSPGVQRRLSLIRHGRALRDLIALLQTESVRHVHAACGDLPGLLAAEAAAKLGLTYSVSVHAHDVFCPKYSDDVLFGSADFVAVCNNRAYRTLEQRMPTLSDRLYLVPHGLRLDQWPMRSLGFHAKPPLKLLFVGRLVDKKQPGHALDILATLKSQGIPATLTILGDGPMRDALVSRAATAKLDVNFHGTVQRRMVKQAMTEHHALLVTSTETADADAEGLPNVIVEAMAVGLPVMTNLTGSVGDIANPDTALIIDSSQPRTVVDAAQALLDARPWLHDMLRNARRRVTEDFDAAELIEARILLLRRAAGVFASTAS